uniref:Complexin-1 n=1 Tax=Hirudo medicinalis TaxID=6421 RepID=CPLX_HIRME|nr:RecName: Full=Complexin-1; Flags: Precursor [Hirudo medicinalis]CAD55800.1 putative complexin 1 [Hirudo medicinalis]
MVSFLGGGLLGNPLSGALEEKEDKKEGDEEEDPEIAEAKREAEEKRNEKYRKMEEEREVMRQGIRDKYHIQKKELPKEDPGLEGRLGRKKKSPDEAVEGGDPLQSSAQSSGFPKNLDDLTAKVKELPGTVMTTVSGATDKCNLQ